MNLKLNIFKKIIAITSATVMVASLAVPVCAGKRRIPVHKAKDAKLANKMLPKEVDEFLLTHKNFVDNIWKKINELDFKLADAIAEYHQTKKDFEFQTKRKDEEEIMMDLLKNWEHKPPEKEIYQEDLNKLEEKIIKLKEKYIAKYRDLRRKFKILETNALKYTNQPAAKNVIENQINMLRNKINSIDSEIYCININFLMCGLYDCLIKFNISEIINGSNYKNSNGFNECIAAINSINLKLKQAVSNNLTINDRESLLSSLNVLNDSFDSLNPNEKIQISLNFLKAQKLLNILDENLKILENNNIMNVILDKAKKTISDYICEFLKFNSINYMNDGDINNYLPMFINNEYIYNSSNINELDQTIFDIFKLTNKKLLDQKYSELVNLPENSEQIRKDVCRLILSDLRISVTNILGKLDNILSSGENPSQNMSDILEKIIKNIKSFNQTFNNHQDKDKFDLLCDFLTKTNLNIQNLQSKPKII